MSKNTKDNILWVSGVFAALAAMILGLPPLFYYVDKYFRYWWGK